MKRSILLLVLILLVGFGVSDAEPFSDTGEHDIGALLEQAQKSYDLDAEDAVILLRQEKWHFRSDGRRIHELHRIVWIRSSRGIRNYADMRVPWDSAMQKLEVETLRSWRPSDRRWTESGPTAIVETTPYAFGHAPDYTNIRETMLLTDGVELPCVLEVRYRIEDQEAFAGGMGGIEVLAKEDPSLISIFEIGTPPDVELSVAAPVLEEPELKTANASGMELTIFKAENVDPRSWPAANATESPYVAWSTWTSREALAATMVAAFETAITLEEGGQSAVRNAVEEARSEIEEAEEIAAWVSDSTGFVRYDRRWFPTPRSAQRSWETAFAHALDRCVLSAAALREVGLEAGLAYRVPRGMELPASVATLAGLEGPLLWVAGDDFQALYDPASSTIRVVDPDLEGSRLWRLGAPPEQTAAALRNRAVLKLDLSWSAEEVRWQGRGALLAEGILSPFSEMQGMEAGRAEEVLAGITGAALEGIELSGFNFESFGTERVAAGFEFTLAAGERDNQDRQILEIGDYSARLGDPLHDADPLYLAERTSTVYLPAPLELAVDLRIHLGDLELISRPGPVSRENTVGNFTLESEESDDEVRLTRTLRITQGEVKPEEWPDLRSLLLDRAAARNSKLVLGAEAD